MLVKHLPEIYLSISTSDYHSPPHSHKFYWKKLPEMSRNFQIIPEFPNSLEPKPATSPRKSEGDVREMLGKCWNNIYLCWNALYIGVSGMHREMLRCLSALLPSWHFCPMRHALPVIWHLSGGHVPYISSFPRREIFGNIWFVLAKNALYQMQMPLLGCQNGTWEKTKRHLR